MWIILTLTCAFSQSLWMALSKRQLQTLSSLRFMLFLRAPIILAIAPMFIWCEHPDVTIGFWTTVLLASVLECVRLISFARGTRRDYYATYSLMNMAPMFVMLLASQILDEIITVPAVGGVLCVVLGGFLFYHAGRFQVAGFVAAVSQGTLTTLCKLGISLSSPTYFMIILYTVSTAMLFVVETSRLGLGATLRAYQVSARRTLPLSCLNLVAILTFIFGLSLTSATNFSVLLRTNLIFGFVLSLILLKEYNGWRWKVAGAGFIFFGSTLIVLSGAS